jgi:4-hydroxybenzoate polyprenyltransferase
MLRTLRHILEMIRFSHTVFALPFALLAALMAWDLRAQEEVPNWNWHDLVALQSSAFPRIHALFAVMHWNEVAGILVCMVAARSAAMAFNRLADRNIDAENPRTRMRHLPAGILSVSSVALFTAFSSVAFIGGTALFLPNRLPLVLSLPVLLFLFGYSYTKRFTALAHFWLGAALMLAPICVWIAIRGEVLLMNPMDMLPAVLLGEAVLAWVAGFDIIYACQDVEFDRQAKLKSIPAVLGVAGALRLAAACHLVTVTLLAALFVISRRTHFATFRYVGTIYDRPSLGWIFAGGVAAIAALLTYEHLIVRPSDLTRVNVAFFNINAIISIGLLVVGAIDLLT